MANVASTSQLVHQQQSVTCMTHCIRCVSPPCRIDVAPHTGSEANYARLRKRTDLQILTPGHVGKGRGAHQVAPRIMSTMKAVWAQKERHHRQALMLASRHSVACASM